MYNYMNRPFNFIGALFYKSLSVRMYLLCIFLYFSTTNQVFP